MYSVLKSYGLNGLNGFAVAVEADVSGGLPAFSLVGLPDSAVRESGDRVRSAVKNLGYKWPDRHITVNLAPADIRKSGPVYDLPLLLAVLASSGQMEEPPAEAAFLGELALDGSLRPVSGVLPMALAAAADGIRSLYVPAENAAEAAEAGGDAMQVYPARTAREVVDALRGLVPLSPAAPIPFDPASGWNAAPDFADVMGEFRAFAPHLVLMDVSLPFHNGYFHCAEIRRESKAPVIFVSSRADDMDVVMAVNMGGDDYFAALEKLAVRNACKGEGELRLSKRDLDRVPSGFADRINAALTDGSVKLSGQSADIDNGFILVYGDIEMNCTFRALINEQKDIVREKVCGVIF